VSSLGLLAFPNAHNLLLTSFAELGTLGLAAVLAAAACFALQARSVLRADPDRRPITLAAIIGVIAFLAHGMLDVIDTPGLTTMLLLVSAFALVPRPDETRPRDAPRSGRALIGPRLTALMALLAMALSLPTLVGVEGAIVEGERAQASIDKDPSRALEAARAADGRAPGYLPAVLVRMRAADAAGEEAEALEAAREAVVLDPLAQHRIAVAVLLARAGAADESMAEARSALAASVADPFVELNAALLLAGDQAASNAATARLLEHEPGLTLLVSTFPEVLAGALPVAVVGARDALVARGAWDEAMLLALAIGDEGAVRVVSDLVPADRRPFFDAIAEGWSGSPSGFARVIAFAESQPSLSRAKWAWLLSARGCDQAGSDRWADVYRLLGPAYPSVPIALGPLPDVAVSMFPPRYPEAVWNIGFPKPGYVSGTWTYRMGTPGCAE
jgi:hypothetical protein